MAKQQLVIAVKEADYVERLAAYIRESPFGEEWQLTAFTNPSAFRHFVKAGYRIDLIAAQPGMLEELDSAASPAPTAALVLHKGECPERPEIMQYQPLPRLLQAFSAACASFGSSALPEPGTGRAEVLAVYGFGGIGATTLALQLSQLASMRGQRVFYLNLEPWNATSLCFGEEGGDDFSLMLYTLQTARDKAPQRLTELRRRHPTLRLDYFAPCGNPDELRELAPGLALELMNAICESGQYDLVVADIGGMLSEVHAELLRFATYPLWLVGRDPVSRRKNRMAVEYGCRKWPGRFDETLRRIRFLQAGQGTASRSCDDGTPIRFDGEIPYIARWRENDEPFGTGGSSEYRIAAEALLTRLTLAEREEEKVGRSGS